MVTHISATLVVALTIAASIEPVLAADDTAKPSVPAADYSLPSSISNSLLGVNTQSVEQPKTPKALVTALKNGSDSSGKFKTGWGVDFVPYLLIAPAQVQTISNYQTDPAVRILSNIQLSVTTAASPGESDGGRAALGIRYTIFDDSDPRIAANYDLKNPNTLVGCLNQVRVNHPLDPKAIAAAADDEDAIRKLEKTNEDVRNKEDANCFPAYENLHWNDPSMDIAFGNAWSSPDRKLSGLKESTFGAFWSYGFPIDFAGLRQVSQVLIGAKYLNNDVVPDKDGTFFNQNSEQVGGRIRIKSGDDYYFNLEGSAVFTQPTGKPNTTYYQFDAGLEVKVADKTWLQLSVGGQTDNKNQKNNVFVLSGFKVAVSDLFRTP